MSSFSFDKKLEKVIRDNLQYNPVGHVEGARVVPMRDQIKQLISEVVGEDEEVIF